MIESHGKRRVQKVYVPVSRSGPEHHETPLNSMRSLTYFYNWSSSHGRKRYALKWVGDVVPTLQGERVLRDLAWQLQGSDEAITLRRDPVYVESDCVAYVDTTPGRAEPWGWRNSPAYTFSKACDRELMLPWPGDPETRLPDAVCFELKWLDADEFAHWPCTDFKAVANNRKRRDGSPPPDNLVRVDRPEEV
jgi:hypothetical protein